MATIETGAHGERRFVSDAELLALYRSQQYDDEWPEPVYYCPHGVEVETPGGGVLLVRPGGPER